jgi:alkylation response protein AidB-like acyl-CoA dehydrogenase
MEFRLSAEQELFKRTVREFCEKNITPVAREIDEKEQGIPDSIIEGLAELGVLGITIPAAYGGTAPEGEEMTYANIAVQEIARAELSMSLPVYVLLQLGWATLVVKHGTEELKKVLLPKVASGKWFLGICTTEAAGGSDVANIKTGAEVKGDKLVINGEKVYISGVRETTEQRDGGHLTLFRTDPKAAHKGMTFAYVPARAKGITPTLFDDIGRGGLSTGGFRYKDVEIPMHYVLGEVNRGFYLNMEGFDVARTLVAAACVGAAEKALEIGREHVKQRVLFGKPLAKFEGISFEIAEDWSRIFQLKLLLQYTAWLIDTFYREPGSCTHRQISEVVSMCKMEAPLLAVEVIKHAMMYMGAQGYTKDVPLGMALRGVMSYVVGAEGGTNIQKLIIAREYIGDMAVPYRD